MSGSPSWISALARSLGFKGGSGGTVGFCLERVEGGAPPVGLRSLIALGRAAGNDIRFDDKDSQVSNHHCSVHLRDGRAFLKDLDSVNGTWIDDRKIEEAEIKEGQEFRLGRNGPRLRLIRRALPAHQPLGTIELGDATRAYVKSVGSTEGTLGGWTHFDPARQKKVLLWFRGRDRKQKKLTRILAGFLVLSAGISVWLFVQVQILKSQVNLHKALVDQLVPDMDPTRRHEAVLRIREQERELAGMRSKLKDYAIRGIYSNPLSVKLHLAAETFGEQGFVLPDAFVASAQRHYQDLMSAYGKRKLKEALGRKDGYETLIREELESAGLPASLIYLVLHESRFDTAITSHVGARGLWQLMPALAGQFGLSVPENWKSLPPASDPRTHPAKCTKAGVKFLGRLFGQYQDPFLAMAAYNSGEPQLNSALRRLKASPGRPKGGTKEAAHVEEAMSQVGDARFKSDYWYLQRMNLLPEETIQYVPKIVATMVAAQELGG